MWLPRKNRSPSQIKVIIYTDAKGEYRWRAVATANGKILAVSSESYEEERYLRQALSALWPDGVAVETR